MPIFSVVDIDEKLFDSAFPLVRTVAPGVSAERWSIYAQKIRIRGGLLGLMGPHSTMFGLLTYRNEDSLRHGQIFVVDNLLTFEFNRAAPGRRALCDAAETLAREQGCNAIELRLDSRGYAIDASVKARSWLNLGHSLEALVFAKSLAIAVQADAVAPVLSAAEG